ncbi:hypothetical protein CHU92_04875 [Flavobacterium cyanobacteriorum]|uniref:PDZ domain-containing protein n=1 Tax=Flavobacterium cyanobacteriorum TaxID=2022802 RepID=A0A255ZAT0_9FLAO|nr:hypothetical protein CHU92_04875 [Flavobacterium cyanobacteriorum]
MSFLDSQSTPFINIKTETEILNSNATVIFDSGDDSFFTFSQHHFDQVVNEVQEKQKQLQEPVTGSLQLFDVIFTSKGSFSFSLNGNADHATYYQYRIKNLTFGQTAFENIIATTTSDNRSRVGFGLLQYGRLILDYRNKKYYFLPYDSMACFNVNHKAERFNATYENNKFRVGIVWDEALQGIMKVGDEILSINEVDFSSLSMCEVLRSRHEKAIEADKLVITLKDIETQDTKVVEIVN